MPDLPITEGLVFFSSMGVVLVGLSIAEKFGLKVNAGLINVVLQTCFWGGVVIMLVFKNPLGKWL